MAVRAVPSGTIGVPLNPLPHGDGSALPGARVQLAPGLQEAFLEVVGRSEKRLAEALHASDVAVSGDITEETIHALRMLAIDNLVDIVQLRESLDEREAEVAELAADLAIWRARALDEGAARTVEAREAIRHERELVSVLHRQINDNYVLNERINAERRPWWRRQRTAQPAI
jgi:hypothetical protein